MRNYTVKSLLVGVILILNLSVAFAQKYAVSGYVTESGSGEPLIGVAVFSKGTSLGTVTSNTGYYTLSLDAGDYTLEFSSLGYKILDKKVTLNQNIKLSVSLEEDSDMLSEAVITSHYNNTGVRGTLMSAIEVPVNQIKAIPAIAGEVDVIKALQLLPGVQNGTEGSAGLYVRGGGADENLLLMDGVPLYNVNHMFGFFSVFNADALKNVTLYKGSFPARFGGHLSSVIDVRTNDGNENELHGSASIGLISSKFNLEGPLVKGKTTFNISARRTYMDLLAKPILAYANREGKEDDENLESYGGGYNFYDINAKITHRLNNSDRISLSLYTGDDKAFVNMTDKSKYYSVVYDPEKDVFERDGTMNISNENMDFSWKWGNLVTALRWNHEISPKLYLNAGTSFTQYRSNLGVAYSEYDAKEMNGTILYETKENTGINYISKINDIGVNIDLEWHPNVKHDIKFGSEIIDHSFKPGIISLKQKYTSDDPEDNVDANLKVGDTPIKSYEGALYFEDNWTITPWLKADLGVRSSLYNVNGKTYFSVEPRLSARALVSNDLSLKASYSEMSQYIHLLCNSNISLPTDLWVPVTDRISPMRSRQVALGAFYEAGKFEFSAETYYKSMDNVLEYKDGASFFGTTAGWEDKVSMGRGWSYGIELLAQKKIGKTTGWIGYTLAKAMRQFNKPGNVINDGNPFPSKYDRRHDLSATVTHAFSSNFDISATFVYSSGNCGTLGTEYYSLGESQLDDKGHTNFNERAYFTGTYIPYRNNYRMPSYNRLDLGMNFYKQKKRGTRIWNISVYNAYNRLNPFLITTDYEYTYDEQTNKHHSRPYLKKISIFPIIPSVSYTYKF